ncbi:polysaccharide biosynthesis protein [Bacteriovoracales bacterium]|nr:polysaccharide biosynthesis protein [Bacteriovoracales bacterium]
MVKYLKELESWKKTTIAAFYDFLTAGLCCYLSLAIRFDSFNIQEIPHKQTLFLYLFIVPIIQLVCFYFLGLYRGIWRFSSTPDLLRVIKGATVGTLVGLLTHFLYNRTAYIPRSSFFIDWTLLVLCLGGGRLGYRIWADNISWRNLDENLEKVLIIGAGTAGAQLLREIRNNPGLGIKVLGLIDDDRNLKGKILYNVPILGTTNELSAILEKTNPNKVFIAIPSATGEQVTKIVEKVKGKIAFKILPKIADIINSKVQLSQLRNLNIEDLLGRDSIKLKTSNIFSMLKGKSIFISGAGGSIGSELCLQVVNFKPKKLILFEQSEFNLYKVESIIAEKFKNIELISIIGDVRNKDKVESIIKEHRPQVVIHAAAYKHVPIMERNPYEAIQTNVKGTKILAELSSQYNVEKFVLISTDKAVNPTNIMGSSKRIGELICQKEQRKSKKTKFTIVRFGNVLGSSGSVIPLFKSQIENGGPITVTHKKIKRYFMSIPEASQLVLEASTLGEGGEIFVLEMGKPIKIYDLAKQMITLSGLIPEVDIPIKITNLRPGEKLFEELLTDDESTLPTQHPKVRVAKGDANLNLLKEGLSDLIQLESSDNITQYKEVIKKILPEYMSPQMHMEMSLKGEHSQTL